MNHPHGSLRRGSLGTSLNVALAQVVMAERLQAASAAELERLEGAVLARVFREEL